MNRHKPIYILGTGAIGFPLAAYLADAGRRVLAVRTSRNDMAKSTVTITVQNGGRRKSIPVETVCLSSLDNLHGTIVIAAKAHANPAIARQLADKSATGPIVLMQNGLGVEKPFVEAGFTQIYRCVLYITSQSTSEHDFAIRPIRPSPIGIITGSPSGLEQCVQGLSTNDFPFRPEPNIQRDIWKKAIINSVFNSICPLLEIDNGIFARNEAAASLARELARECATLTDTLNLGLSENELMGQIQLISQGSNQFISTLQDLRSGRPTEIEFLNLEIARLAAARQPPLQLPRIELLGKMILAKSQMRMA